MTSEERERMNSLCVGIQEETDYNKFAVLLHEMSELIALKEWASPQACMEKEYTLQDSSGSSDENCYTCL
jgi:hypothetical protein